jgi:hypothetical protein
VVVVVVYDVLKTVVVEVYDVLKMTGCSVWCVRILDEDKHNTVWGMPEI